MKELNFRTLTAEDVKLRVARVVSGKNGSFVELLIYKDARVDQDILDETVGQMNWRKSYKTIKDNLFCSIDIYDAEKREWISKEDVGVESNTEEEKGEASDAQKRAGFAWGIGRELYTAPKIFIDGKLCNIEKTTKGTLKCNNTFAVSAFKVENKKIVDLQVINTKSGEVVFDFVGGKRQVVASTTTATKTTSKTTTVAKTKAEEKIQKQKELVTAGGTVAASATPAKEVASMSLKDAMEHKMVQAPATFKGKPMSYFISKPEALNKNLTKEKGIEYLKNFALKGTGNDKIAAQVLLAAYEKGDKTVFTAVEA